MAVTIIDAGVVIYQLVTSVAVSTASVVCAAAFAVIGIAVSAIAIALSVIGERKLRDKLKISKRDITEAIAEMENAENKMTTMQSDLYNKLVKPLQKFAKQIYAVTKDSVFNDLDKHLDLKMRVSFSWFSFTIIATSKITYTWLSTLHSKLEAVVQYTNTYNNELQELVQQQEDLKRYLDTIKSQVNNGLSPPSIHNAVQLMTKPALLKNKFDKLGDLVNYIAVDVLKSTSCYWGFDLNYARNCQSCLPNYICDSSQLSGDKQKIIEKMTNMEPPCRIKASITNDIFTSLYKVVKYIAQYVEPNIACYWGYDLAGVRSERLNADVIDGSTIDKSLYMTLEFLYEDDPITDLRGALCSDAGVCDNTWQNMLFCVTNTAFSTHWNLHCGAYNNCKTEMTKRFRCPRT